MYVGTRRKCPLRGQHANANVKCKGKCKGKYQNQRATCKCKKAMPIKEDAGAGFARPTNAEAPGTDAPRHQAPMPQAQLEEAKCQMQMQNAKQNAFRRGK